MKLSSIKIDAARLEQGAWVGDIPDMPGLRLKVRGLGNVDFRRLQAKLVNAVPRKERRNGLNPETQDAIAAKCMAQTVLQDWSGLEDDDGQPIPYTADRAANILADPDLVGFRDAVVYAAGRVAETDEDAVDDLVGN